MILPIVTSYTGTVKVTNGFEYALVTTILKIGYFGKVIKVGSYCYHC
ncbi:hypothetical protein ANME2D_00690 [Candidatus Methanoperedens nitroreducens]|uniref:Uncharacterized protein n=1 Tax=Candidatus Methanoperedens nitratireducens TaxID=1392998 RepID=A0A062VD76_9EURY|nr:hypothetical protein ANME2D_00690 [Candidatus Methanoperedens nitroreducens]